MIENMCENRPAKRRNAYSFREQKLSPRQPRPLGLNLDDDQLERAAEFGIGCERTVPEPTHDESRTRTTLMKCTLCQSEFTNELAMLWHEYCSHRDELVEDGENWHEYKERCQEGDLGEWSGDTDASA